MLWLKPTVLKLLLDLQQHTELVQGRGYKALRKVEADRLTRRQVPYGDAPPGVRRSDHLLKYLGQSLESLRPAARRVVCPDVGADR